MPDRPDPWLLAVVTIGGGVGSTARYAIESAIHPAADGFPTATLLINCGGAFLLGVLVALVSGLDLPRLVRPAFGTGLLGGFTTFSTFAAESRGLTGATAVGYVAASLAGGVLAAALGLSTTRATLRRSADRDAAGRSAPRPEPDPIDPDLP